jgi:predicted DNA-binding ribbon-helix-helix protein
MAGSARPGGLVKGSVLIAGHATSVSLEPLFWTALREAAAADGRTVTAIITEIDEARTTNLSSAIRVWLLARARAQLG